MLYYLFDYLKDYTDIPGGRLFEFVTFRSAMAFMIALLFSTIAGKRIIGLLQKLQIGETIRDLGLEGQMSKKGTPTMGGVIIILSILIPCLLVSKLHNIYMIMMIITTIWLGFIGLVDDYIKVVKKDKEGLSGRYKIVGQVGLGLIVGVMMYASPDIVIRENNTIHTADNVETIHYNAENIKSTQTTIPFVKDNNFDYSSIVGFMGDKAQSYGWVVFILMAIFVVTAVSNGANLTDGLDGLATGSSAIIGSTLGVLAYLSSHIEYSSYLNIMYIPGSEELVVFTSAFIGATIGFLWYNAYPAQVFMGDTGSLTIGGIIAVLAIALHKELLLPMLCGVFFVESLSVMMQVSYFKYTKRKTGVGKRIFRMTPIHHHFQKGVTSGLNSIMQMPKAAIPESKIVTRFWIIGILLAVLTIVTLKIR